LSIIAHAQTIAEKRVAVEALEVGRQTYCEGFEYCGHFSSVECGGCVFAKALTQIKGTDHD
jgi:hypothetical protein